MSKEPPKVESKLETEKQAKDVNKDDKATGEESDMEKSMTAEPPKVVDDDKLAATTSLPEEQTNSIENAKDLKAAVEDVIFGTDNDNSVQKEANSAQEEVEPKPHSEVNGKDVQKDPKTEDSKPDLEGDSGMKKVFVNTVEPQLSSPIITNSLHCLNFEESSSSTIANIWLYFLKMIVSHFMVWDIEVPLY